MAFKRFFFYETLYLDTIKTFKKAYQYEIKTNYNCAKHRQIPVSDLVNSHNYLKKNSVLRSLSIGWCYRVKYIF